LADELGNVAPDAFVAAGRAVEREYHRTLGEPFDDPVNVSGENRFQMALKDSLRLFFDICPHTPAFSVL